MSRKGFIMFTKFENNTNTVKFEARDNLNRIVVQGTKNDSGLWSFRANVSLTKIEYGEKYEFVTSLNTYSGGASAIGRVLVLASLNFLYDDELNFIDAARYEFEQLQR